jgi:hypothetical protein
VIRLMTRSFTLILSMSLMALQPSLAAIGLESANDLCQAEVAFNYLNGVQTTPGQADHALRAFQQMHRSDVAGTGDRIRYELLYNHTAGFEDFVETFEQRLLEQENLLGGRFELFFEAVRGEGPWWSSIINAVSSAAGIFTGLVDWFRSAAAAYLTSLAANPPTMANYAEHRTRIDSMLLEGRKLLFVAHSQGNLFANAAYGYALGKVSAGSVKVVHIAPASPTVSGPHTLANLDLVVNGLRLVGTVPPNTDDIPAYPERTAGANGMTDRLGHGLLEIYLHPGMAPFQRIKGHIDEALNTLEAPPRAGTGGFFTATLTWDGEGDVDLHTFEPGGVQVHYAARVGDAGWLDVDNTVANGPEHYYATCDQAVLQEGTYRFSLANYDRADGRNATLQIASWSDGVLGTKSVTLGAPTGDDPAYDLFHVIVKKHPETGRFDVSLQP